MKTKIRISIICLCFLCKLQAQVFPTSDAIWSIKSDDVEFAGEIKKGGVWYYGLSGDTIIGDVSYNKLYLLNDTTLNIDSKDKYVGGFWQEEKKVWFRPSSDYFRYIEYYGNPPYTEETILYDFSKNAGDTIWHNFNTWTMKDSIAMSIITSIEIDEQERKIYHIESYEHYYDDFFELDRDRWIEGIGGMHGLWGFLSPKPTCICPEPYLACFKQGNEVKYMDARCNSCFPGATGILEKNTVPLEVIYENNSIRIQGEPFVFPCELKLFSSVGQLVLRKGLQSNKEIQVGQLKGIYLYQVQKNGEIMKTGKIIIN